MSSMQPKWNTGHFPTGTVCETELFEKRTFTVRSISCNGPGSFVLHTDIPSKIIGLDFDSLNINHVSRIIKRGEGKVDIEDSAGKVKERYIEDQKFSGNILKHKSQYMSFLGTSDVIRYVVSKYVKPDMIIDYEKLSEALFKQGVFRSKNMNECIGHAHPFYMYKCNKKRLNKTVKRIINKVLIPMNVAIKEEEKFYSDLDFDHDMDMMSDRLDKAERREENGSCYDLDYKACDEQDNWSPFDNRKSDGTAHSTTQENRQFNVPTI